MRKLAYIILLLITACKPDKPDDPKPEEGFVAKGKGVFICNEGNFQFGNASVSCYNSEKNEVVGDLFRTINNRGLGDVCQSMMIDGDLAYIVINNSSKVEVVQLPSFASLRTIQGLPSPRYMVKASEAKAYVSNYYSNHISIVNTVTGLVTGQIPCFGWTEQMIRIDDKIYVVNIKSKYLYVLDPASDIISDSILVNGIVSGIAVDKNKKIWVSCNSEKSASVTGSLKKIDPLTKTIVSSMNVTDINYSPSALSTNGAGDSLYYTYNGVYKTGIDATALPVDAFIPQGSKIFYGLGVDPSNGDIYVSDAIDYVQKGKVLRYSSAGILKAEFNAGIIPGNFVFYR